MNNTDYNPVVYNNLKQELNRINVNPKLLKDYTKLKHLSDIEGKQVAKVVNNYIQSIIIVFTDKTYVSLYFEAEAYCQQCDCEVEIQDEDYDISTRAYPTFQQLVNTGILDPDAIAQYSEINSKLVKMEKLKQEEKNKALELREREELARLKAKYE